MPQVFQVLKCYKCNVFQVHQTKKANKFACKMCGEKQSIKRHYGIGNGQECRGHVQKLNAMRGELNETNTAKDFVNSEDEEFEGSSSTDFAQKKCSKWLEFVENNEVIETANEGDTILFENRKVVLEIPKKKRQKRSNNNQSCHTEPQKSNEMASPEICSAIQEEYNIEAYAKYKPATQNTRQIQLKHGNLQKGTTLDTLEKSKSEENGNNLDNIDICTVTTENSSETLDTCNTYKLKFIPPVINANSKWAKFTESQNDQEEVSEAKYISSNVYESQFDEITINNTNISNSKLSLSNNDEKKLVLNTNLQQSNRKPLPTELKGVVDYERNKFNKDIADSDCINNVNNVSINNPNGKNFLIDQNDSVEYNNNNNSKLNELDHNNVEQKGKENLKRLFSLCDDEEIDRFLDI